MATKTTALACSTLALFLVVCVGPPRASAAASEHGAFDDVLLAKSTAEKNKGHAKKLYKAALASYGKGRWQEALDGFRSVAEITTSPRLDYYIGMCLLELERWLEAESALEAYLASGSPKNKKDAKRRNTARAALEEIADHVGEVTVECDEEEAMLEVDGEPTGSWVLRLEEGEHELAVTWDGGDAIVKTVDVPGGGSVTVGFEHAPPVPASGGEEVGRKKLPVYWLASSAALAGTLALAAVITGSVALAREDDYGSMGYEQDWRSYRRTTLRLGLATDVLWGVAGAAALAAALLAVFTDFEGVDESEDPTAVPVIRVTGIGLQGEF